MKKKVLVVAALVTIVILLAGFVPGAQSGGAGGKAEAAPAVVELKKGNIATYVSATGTVQSENVTSVYSNLNYPVKTVHVKAGDPVSAGDMLCELDASSLESQIAQKSASANTAYQKAQQSLAVAQNDLDTHNYNVERGYDSALANAEASVKTAELDLASAASDYRAARAEYNDAIQDNESSDATLEKLYSTQEQRRIAWEKAEYNLEKAKDSLRIAEIANKEDAISLRQKVDSAKLSTNLSDQWLAIEDLKADLEKAIVTAPVSGVVTAVMAVEGGSGSGELFIIQDAGNLRILTNIKEYDIGGVAPGNRVTIESDATGDRVFEGELAKIAPTSTTTAKGEDSVSTDVEFAAEVAVATKNSGLRIGMTTRLSIITDEHKDVFAVPYESVGRDPEGNPVVYRVVAGEDGKTSYEIIPVTVGLESELYTEVSSDRLTEGMQILKSADDAGGGTPSAGQSGQPAGGARGGMVIGGMRG